EAVRLLAAGGQRAEVELVASEVLALLRSGTEPGDVAVVYRDPAAYASLVGQVFDAYGIPFALSRELPFRHTSVGRGLLALMRCALLDGSEADLLAYLRTPGKLGNQALADRLEAEVRQDGAETAERARELWELRRWPLEEIDTLRAAAKDGPGRLLRELRFQLERLFSAPYMRQARLLDGAEREDARAFEAAASALEQLRGRPRCRAPARHARRTGGVARRAGSARPGARGAARARPRPPLRGGVRLRAPGGRVPARAPPGAVPAR